MKKTLELNISERLAALSILNDFKGNLSSLSVVIGDVKQFPVEPTEWDKAGKAEVVNENGNTTWTWDNEKGGLKSIVVDELTETYICDSIKERDAKGEFTLQDRPYITLLEKLT